MTCSIKLHRMLGLAILASVFSLGVALTSEYVFGLKPCELCLFQRIPYAFIIAIAPFGLWKKQWAFTLLVVIALLFLMDSGIGLYHAGVEKHWIPGPEACTDSGDTGHMTLEQIMAKIRNAPLVACDQPQWEFHGITMAALNGFWALWLTLLFFCALHKYKKKEEVHARTAG